MYTEGLLWIEPLEANIFLENSIATGPCEVKTISAKNSIFRNAQENLERAVEKYARKKGYEIILPVKGSSDMVRIKTRFSTRYEYSTTYQFYALK